MTTHVPVMVAEVLSYLGSAHHVVDMTLGAGGHSEALLQAGVAQVTGVDRDPVAREIASRRLAPFGSRFVAIAARFSQVLQVGPVDGVLYDLGVSSMQLDEPERGFSFRAFGPLDMRMDQNGEHEEIEGPWGRGYSTAADLVNELPESELEQLLRDFGEERRARTIAQAIVRARARARIETTDQLASVVASATGRRPGGPHPARRTFQALRLAVNRELEELSASLPQAVGLLSPGGRMVVLSYHSLEDRIVKYGFKDDPRLTVLTKKVLRPTNEEIEANPRARSAFLRAAERNTQDAEDAEDAD